MHDKNHDKTTACMACSCPCDLHKEHTHDEPSEEKEHHENAKCMACECSCDEHKEHAH